MQVSVANRAAVVMAARSWLGTPYHHAANVRGAGVDCAMLLIEVYAAAGVIERFDPRPYTADWFLHRDEEKFMGLLLQSAHEVETPGLGDIMLFKIGRLYAHGAVVVATAPLTIVHAFAPARCVVEDVIRQCPDLAEKPRKFFSHWGNSPQVGVSRLTATASS
jgi:hypothetical protein